MRWLWMLLVVGLAACNSKSPPPTPALPSPTTVPTVNLPTLVPTSAPTSVPSVTPAPTAPPTARPTPDPLPPGAVLFYQKVDGSLWAASADGTGPRPIIGAGSAINAHVGAWSPSSNGQSVAAILINDPSTTAGATTTALWVVSTQGIGRRITPRFAPSMTLGSTIQGEMLSVVRNPGAVAWSPDGKRLAAVSAHEGQPDIYIFDLASAQTLRLTNSPLIETHFAWSPDGSWLTFAELEGHGLGNQWRKAGVRLIKTDGSGGNVVLAEDGHVQESSEAAFNWEPLIQWIGADTLLWAPATIVPVPPLTATPIPNSDTLAMLAYYSPQLAKVSGEQRILVPGRIASFNWNNERRRLAIAALAPITGVPNGEPGLWVYNFDEDKLNRVSQSPVTALAWPPGGDTGLAYSSQTDGATNAILRRDASERVLGAPSDSMSTIIWSPDGQQVAVGTHVYDRLGNMTATLPASARPITWGPAGLWYVMTPGGSQNAVTLGLWTPKTSTNLGNDIDARAPEQTIRLVIPR